MLQCFSVSVLQCSVVFLKSSMDYLSTSKQSYIIAWIDSSLFFKQVSNYIKRNYIYLLLYFLFSSDINSTLCVIIGLLCTIIGLCTICLYCNLHRDMLMQFGEYKSSSNIILLLLLTTTTNVFKSLFLVYPSVLLYFAFSCFTVHL